MFIIVSDLHIDHWNNKYIATYPCGNVKHKPFNIEQYYDAHKYLIVAGDVSDNIDMTIHYLHTISKHFKKILFVEGNHEHVLKYPNLYSYIDIQTKINKICGKDNNIHYLSIKPYIIDKTVFIGYCGWWDYNNMDTICVNNNINNYFKNWIPLHKLDSELFYNHVVFRSKREAKLLQTYIREYENDPTIEKIVIVTHTVPMKELTSENYGTIGNTSVFDYIISENHSKIKYWIYGHTHYDLDIQKKNDITFIRNSRGRPDDHNREDFEPLVMDL
jgi:hypothetical protein